MNWIPVSKCLPDADANVLVWVAEGYIELAQFTCLPDGSWYFSELEYLHHYNSRPMTEKVLFWCDPYSLTIPELEERLAAQKES